MADQNVGEPSQATDGKPPHRNNDKPKGNMTIVAYNLLGLALYTIVFKSLSNQGGIIVDALILVGHVLVCLILAIANRSWIWALSGVLVLVIGFSTCVTVIGGVH